jgi:hypothetical protein
VRMAVKDLKDAERIALAELRDKLPNVMQAIEKEKATISMREYKTRKGRDVYELTVREIVKVKVKEKEIEIPKITFVTVDKKTGEKKIAIRG